MVKRRDARTRPPSATATSGTTRGGRRTAADRDAAPHSSAAPRPRRPAAGPSPKKGRRPPTPASAQSADGSRHASPESAAPAAATQLIIEQADAARRLGVTDRQLRNWLREPGFPGISRGYDLAAIRAWIEERGRKGSDQDGASKRIRLARDAERLQIEQCRRQQAELDLRERQRELLPRRGWELFAATLLTQLGDWCDQLPDLVGGVCPKQHRRRIADRLRQELDARRVSLRAALERQARELEEELRIES